MGFLQLWIIISIVCSVTAFHTQPMNTTVLPGNNVTFLCEVDDPDAYVFWKMNHTDIISVNRDIANKDKAGKYSVGGVGAEFHLNVYNVGLADEGWYECEVGEDKQASYLNVVIPPKVTLEPDNAEINVELGTDLTIACTSTGKPSPLVTWTKVGGMDSDVLQAQDQISKSFSPVQKTDTGRYSCEAGNQAGMDSRDIDVNVRYSPTLTVQEEFIHTGPGEHITITCDFLASPQPTVQWRQNQVKLIAGDNQPANIAIVTELVGSEEGDLTRSTLHISGVRPGDLGVYRCTGWNDWGSMQQNINVSGIPEIMSVFSEGENQYINQYSLQWQVRSKPALVEYHLSLSWVNDTTFLKHQRNYTLNVGDVSKSDSEGVHHSVYNIPDLMENVTYTAQLRARNVIGVGGWSQTYTFSTPSDGELAPMDVKDYVYDTDINAGFEPMRMSVTTTILAAILVVISLLL